MAVRTPLRRNRWSRLRLTGACASAQHKMRFHGLNLGPDSLRKHMQKGVFKLGRLTWRERQALKAGKRRIQQRRLKHVRRMAELAQSSRAIPPDRQRAAVHGQNHQYAQGRSSHQQYLPGGSIQSASLQSQSSGSSGSDEASASRGNPSEGGAAASGRRKNSASAARAAARCRACGSDPACRRKTPAQRIKIALPELQAVRQGRFETDSAAQTGGQRAQQLGCLKGREAGSCRGQGADSRQGAQAALPAR